MIAGPKVADVVARYTWLTGGQAFAPKWSLGFGITSMSIADAPDADARVTAFIADCRRFEIPCDSFHFGSGYSSIGHRRYVFNWNRDKFPDPAGTMKRLADAGMRPITNIKPCLLDDHPKLADAMAKGILVRDATTGEPAVSQFWDGLGFHVDFTNPAGAAWWREGLDTRLLDFGVVSAWNDNNEFEIWDEDAQCDGAGRPFAQGLNRPAQAMLMTRISVEAQTAKRPGERPYTISRAGGPGLGRYAQTWSGDNYTAWKTLRWNLRQGLGMGVSGLFNIGHGPSPGPELLCRFVEFCSLWPRFVMNSWKADGVVTLPWMHPSVLQQIRNAYRTRYRLMPHIYTAMWQGSTIYLPPVRAQGFDFPADARAAREEESFLLGDGLLVAPVLDEGATRRAVYLPDSPGGWYELDGGAWHAPGAVAEVDAPLGVLPIFARAGAMIGLSDQLHRIDPATDVVRRLRVFAPRRAGVCVATLYDDDGLTPDHARGAGCVTVVTLDTRGAEPVLSATRSGTWDPPYGAIQVEWVGFAATPRIDPGSVGLLAG
jgi:alpha-glucosidase